MMRTTRRRLLALIGLGTVAAAVGTGKAEASTACEGCDWLRGNQPPLPLVFQEQVTPELTDMVIGAVHAAAGNTSKHSHQVAASMIYAKAFHMRGQPGTFTTGAQNIKFVGAEFYPMVTGDRIHDEDGSLRRAWHV